MSQVIKEIRLTRVVDGYTHSSVSVLRGTHYGGSITAINKWVAIAKETYPELSDDSIRVVQFGGDSYRGTFGIEFNTPGDGLTAPDGWAIIPELEKTL
jgi:hypothetical protein